MIPIQKVFFALRSAFFVPHAVLLSAAGINPSSIAQTFTWDLAPTVSTVTLPPGGTYRLEVPLSAVLTLPPKPQLLSLGVSTKYGSQQSSRFSLVNGVAHGVAWARSDSVLRLSRTGF